VIWRLASSLPSFDALSLYMEAAPSLEPQNTAIDYVSRFRDFAQNDGYIPAIVHENERVLFCINENTLIYNGCIMHL
jgi:hypothetical protein